MDVMHMTPVGMLFIPLLFMAVYAAAGFAVVYFAVRLAIRHEARRKP